MRITGIRLQDRAQRAQHLAAARAFRFAMKPHFDAIYGPEHGADGDDRPTAATGRFPYPHANLAKVWAGGRDGGRA